MIAVVTADAQITPPANQIVYTSGSGALPPSTSSTGRLLFNSVNPSCGITTGAFGLAPDSLANFVSKVGFSSLYECVNPYQYDAETGVLMWRSRGRKSTVLSSPKTEALGLSRVQRWQGCVYSSPGDGYEARTLPTAGLALESDVLVVALQILF